MLSTTFYVDAEVASSKSSFALKFNTLLWLLTTGLQFAVGWWYRRQPVFFLPQGWFGPLGWWLALPFAPAGTSFFFPTALDISFGAVYLMQYNSSMWPSFTHSQPAHLPRTQSSWHHHPSHLFLLFFFFWKEVIRDWCLCEYFAGSVSVGVWQIACRRLIVVGEKTVKSFAGK